MRKEFQTNRALHQRQVGSRKELMNTPLHTVHQTSCQTKRIFSSYSGTEKMKFLTDKPATIAEIKAAIERENVPKSQMNC